MKIKIGFFLICSFLLSQSMAFAQAGNETHTKINTSSKNVDKSGDVGLGLMFGSTPGLTAKFWTNETNAFNLGLGLQTGNTALIVDYLWHWRDAFAGSAADPAVAHAFVPYLGIGGIGVWGGSTGFFNRDTREFGFGVRIPAGLEYLPRGLPLGFFAELDPGIGLVPDGFTFLEGNLGGRFYF